MLRQAMCVLVLGAIAGGCGTHQTVFNGREDQFNIMPVGPAPEVIKQIDVTRYGVAFLAGLFRFEPSPHTILDNAMFGMNNARIANLEIVRFDIVLPYIGSLIQFPTLTVRADIVEVEAEGAATLGLEELGALRNERLGIEPPPDDDPGSEPDGESEDLDAPQEGE